MQCVYEASNALEAHMILNLLEQQGITARVDGEYLQGGVGELQAIGIVRVVVEEGDITEAREIIKAWDELQKSTDTSPNLKKQNTAGMFMLGALLGAVVVAIFYNTPVSVDGIDNNGDGQLDEKWHFVDDRLTKTEVDRNFDGKMDYISEFNRKGVVTESQADDNFDGVFESTGYYRGGNIRQSRSDTTGDGFDNYRVEFKNGLADVITFYDPVTQKPIKIQYYGEFMLITEELDTDNDGILDLRRELNALEEVITSQSINER